MNRLAEDIQFGIIDRRASDALRKLGVFPRSLDGVDGSFHKAVFNFSFSGDRELAKYHVSTFLEDEYNATNITFYARLTRPSDCYAMFTIREERPIDEQEVEANNRRSDRGRKASNRSAGD